tara:strand:- start:20331 stop:20486 length:156 start_codon:yes stop_codon:yes gene_type:complete
MSYHDNPMLDRFNPSDFGEKFGDHDKDVETAYQELNKAIKERNERKANKVR